MKKVYICSPYRGPELLKNYVEAKNWCRLAILAGQLPIATHVYLPPIIQDGGEETPEQRETAMKIAMELVPVCDMLRVCGSRISEGMEQEIRRAEACGVPVEFLDEKAKHIWKTKGARENASSAENQEGLL